MDTQPSRLADLAFAAPAASHESVYVVGFTPEGKIPLIETPSDGRTVVCLPGVRLPGSAGAPEDAIEAFRVIGRKGGRFRVLFTSDSQYLVKGMTEWVYGWASRGWRRKEGAIENLALWQELVSVASPHRVQWQWVRGHAGHPQNEYANDLAVQAAKEQSSSEGARTSRFEEWLEAQRVRKRVMVEPAPFPSGRPFAPTRPLPRVSTTSH